HVLAFIEADLDEVVPGAKRSQVIHALLVINLGILDDDLVVSRLHLRPHIRVTSRSIRPSAAVVRATVVSASMRHSLFNRRTDPGQYGGKAVCRKKTPPRQRARTQYPPHPPQE